MPKLIVAVVTASLLVGCGSSSDTTPTVAGPAPGEVADQDREAARVKAEAQYANCNRDVGSFVATLNAVDRRLRAPIRYRGYTSEVDRLKAAYDKVPQPPDDPACTSGVGIPAEKALNLHIDASTAWGVCQSKASCTDDTIAPRLRRYWLLAATLTGRAKSNLEGLRTP